ncbi:MAG: DUF3800 domain-containing protein [Phycisphaerales bacterium]|nr:DUF3800 domain-containing protein [Phycisphaerales bacterium]
MAVLFLDESGYTGSDLLSSEQPIFVVSSLLLTPAEVQDAVAVLRVATTARELKFKALARRVLGQQAILAFAKHMDAKRPNMRFQLYHKRYALLGKLLECIVEPVFHEAGCDFWENGFNLQYLNVLFHCGESLAKRSLERVLTHFQAFCRNPSASTLDGFTTAVVAFGKTSTGCHGLIQPILDGIEFHRATGRADVGRNALELQVTSVVSLVRAWNDEVTDTLELRVDSSSTIAAAKPALLEMTRPAASIATQYVHGRAVGLPLRFASIEVCDSKAESGIQLADIAAGMVRHAAEVLNGMTPVVEHFSEALLAIVQEWPRVSQVFPELKFTADDVGRLGFRGSGIIDATAEAFRRARDR